MKKLFPLFGLLLLTGACERLVEEVPLSPLNVYPNPFTDRFNVFVNWSFTPNASRLRVLNGEEESIAVFFGLRGGEQFQVDMSNEPPGIYYLEIQFEDNTIFETVVKTE